MKKLLKSISWDIAVIWFALIVFWVVCFFWLGSIASGAEKWDKTEKTLFAVNVSANIVDTLQTTYIFSSSRHNELNPIINGGVNLIGEGFIPLYFIGTSIFEWWIANNLSPGNRKIYLGVISAVEIGVVSRNAYIGVGLKF